MNDLHLSSYMTKKGSDGVTVKYFLPKKTAEIGAVQLDKFNGVDKNKI